MQTLIKLKIERLTEGQQEYFVATSDDLQGLVAEGKTLQETIEIATDVAQVLLELEKETHQSLPFKGLPSQFEYPYIKTKKMQTQRPAKH